MTESFSDAAPLDPGAGAKSKLEMTALQHDFTELNKKLQLLQIGSPRTKVRVSFTALYATTVHENLQVNYKVGQAKYLEQPARLLRDVLIQLMLDTFKKQREKKVPFLKALETALLVTGLRLQREAQLLTPVDTGFLRNSAQTQVEV